MPTITAEDTIVGLILRDLRDRNGLRAAWDSIRPAIQAEITEAWVAIVRKELAFEARVAKVKAEAEH